VNITEHDPPDSPQLALEKAPVPADQEMDPVGVVLGVAVSLTDAVHVIGAFTASVYGGHVTTVLVLSGGGVQVMVT
jgi:hypothetical protein